MESGGADKGGNGPWGLVLMSLADLVLACPQRGRHAVWKSSWGVNQPHEHLSEGAALQNWD